MKIAVLSDDGITVAQHGGRAHGCVMFDADDVQQTGEFLPLPDNECEEWPVGQPHVHHEGSGHNHDHILNIANDCQVVISRAMGRHLRDDLQRRGIRAITTDELDVHRVVWMFSAGTLISTLEHNCGRH